MAGDFDFTVDVSEMLRLARALPGESETFLDAEAEEGITYIKLSFGTSPPGRSYPRGSRVHVASQPGHPPNVDMGTLRASMRWEREGTLTRHLMDGVLYGVMLELGTRHMAARPFVGPAFEHMRRGFGDRFRAHLQRRWLR